MEASLHVGSTEPEGHVSFARLLNLMRQINEGASRDHVFTLVADALRQTFGIDRFSVVLTDEDGSLHITASRGLSDSYLAHAQARIAEGAGARALSERRPVWIQDAAESEDFWPLQEAARQEGFQTVLILPLFSAIEPLGYIVMYHDDVRSYTSAEIALAQALAQQVAFSVQTARLLAATEARRTELERHFQERVAEAQAIDDIVLSITSSLDLGSTLQAIADAASTLSHAPYSSIWLRDETGSYRPMSAHGVPLARLQRIILPPASGLMSEMVKTRQPAQTNEFLNRVMMVPEARKEAEITAVRATLGVPMVQDGEVVGALYVGSTETRSFSPDTIRMLKRLVAFAQVALQNAQRFSDVQAERSQLQAYFDSIPEGLIVFDPAGSVLLVNDTLQREWDIRVPIVGLTHDDIFQVPQRYTSRSLRFRFDPATVFERVRTSGESEQGLVEMEGTSRIFSMHFSPLRQSGRGIEGFVAMIRDVTVPLELVRERSRSHLLAQLLDTSAFLNSNLSVPALMERVVEAACSLVGARSGTLGLIEGDRLVFRRFLRPEGWIDFNVQLRRGEGAPGYVWETMKPYVSNDCVSDCHVLSTHQQNLQFYRLVSVPMVDKAGKLVGTLNAYDPVVERDFGQSDVEALQLLAHQGAIAIENARLSQLKDEFLSIVSHELKTPVTSIKGFTQVLQRRLSPESLERADRYLTVINHQSDRLAALINDLLDLSRIQTGRFSFEIGAVDLAVLVREIVDEMQLVSPHNHLEVRAPQQAMVRGNAERLRQVLINLIDNALKHGPFGGAVHVTVTRGETEVVACVQDEGAGLPIGEDERIFQPYYQVRNHAVQQARGLGLGLYISRTIMDEHGGRIWVGSRDRTTFCFSVQPL